MSTEKSIPVVTMPVTEETDTTVMNVVPKHDRLWIFYPHLRMLNFFMLAPILAQVVSGYDGSMMNNLQSIDVWQEYFDNPSGARLGTMNNGLTVGALISFPFVGITVDYLGRKISLIVGALIIIVGAIVQGCAQDFSAFLAARIVLGIGACLTYTSGGPLATECAYPTQRASVTAMLLASYPFGSFVAALVTRASFNTSSLTNSNWSWRIPSLLQGFFPLVQICVALVAPESPRWLVSKGKVQKARDFFVKYHAGGDENHMIVTAQMAEIENMIELEKAQKMSSWLNWFKTKGLRKRFALVCFVPAMNQLEGNALVSYYLHIILNNIGITGSIQQLNINLGLTVWGFVFSIFVAAIADRFKRRTMFLTALSLMLTCYIIFTALSAVNQQRNFQDKGLAIGTVAFIYLFNGFYHIGSCIATPYILELSPYALRAKGASIYQLTGNTAGLFNNYVNPIAMVAITWKYYIVWCVWLFCLIGIVYFFFPETAGYSLEEIDVLFDPVYTSTVTEKLDHDIHEDNHV